MKNLVAVLILGCIYVAAAEAAESWQAARWNMTVAEVRAAVPGVVAANKRDQEYATNPSTNVRLKTSATFVGESFAVYYEFTPEKAFGTSVDKLKRITLLLVPYDGRKTAVIIQRLTAKYGPPETNVTEADLHHVVWFYSGDQIWLAEMLTKSYVAHSPSLEIVFQPAP